MKYLLFVFGLVSFCISKETIPTQIPPPTTYHYPSYKYISDFTGKPLSGAKVTVKRSFRKKIVYDHPTLADYISGYHYPTAEGFVDENGNVDISIVQAEWAGPFWNDIYECYYYIKYVDNGWYSQKITSCSDPYYKGNMVYSAHPTGDWEPVSYTLTESGINRWLLNLYETSQIPQKLTVTNGVWVENINIAQPTVNFKTNGKTEFKTHLSGNVVIEYFTKFSFSFDKALNLTAELTAFTKEGINYIGIPASKYLIEIALEASSNIPFDDKTRKRIAEILETIFEENPATGEYIIVLYSFPLGGGSQGIYFETKFDPVYSNPLQLQFPGSGDLLKIFTLNRYAVGVSSQSIIDNAE